MPHRPAALLCQNVVGRLLKIDYSAAAEVYYMPMRRKGGARQRLGYRRFATAAEAVRFVVEDFPAPHTLSPWMQVGDDRFDSDAIRQLYDSSDYPLGAAAKNSRREADGFRKVPAKTRGEGSQRTELHSTARPTKRIAASRVR